MTKHNYVLIVTADHGNAEEKLDPNSGYRLSEHTTNPVPFWAIGAGIVGQNIEGALYEREPTGFLSDVAPTVLSLMEIPLPKEMTGHNLLEHRE